MFDYGSFVLKALSDRKADKCGYVCYVRFLQLIFSHLCPNAVFENDTILPICIISENNIKSLINSDKTNGFQGNALIPDEVRLLLSKRMSTYYGPPTSAMEQDQTPIVPDTSTSQKTAIQTVNHLWCLTKGIGYKIKEIS